jgi:Ser/Thr protein kinase RdoA (MazF antagonist)
VRHNPGRRWVGVLEREAAPDLLLRAYSSTARMVRAAGCYKTLGRTEVPTPHPVGKSRSLAALAVSWTEGDTLELAGGEDRWRAAGNTLARLHDSTHVKLPTPAPGHDGAAVERAAEQIAHLLPAIADEVRSLAGTTVRLLEDAPDDRVPLHGDFSADQVVVGPDGVPVLIDLDSAHWGSAATDLGCLVASTLTEAETLGAASQAERDVAALLAGYLGVRRPPDRFSVAVQEIAFRLRKAADPFRTCDPDWAEQVTRRVERTRAALDALVTVGLPR